MLTVNSPHGFDTRSSDGGRTWTLVTPTPFPGAVYGLTYVPGHQRLTVVATGLSRQGVRRHAPPLQVLRTGTDNVPFNVPTLNAVSGVGNTGHSSIGSAQPDYGNLSVPSVWRTNRTQAAAKVDALASGGMDDFEIPAFLRKQAD